MSDPVVVFALGVLTGLLLWLLLAVAGAVVLGRGIALADRMQAGEHGDGSGS